MNRDAGRSEPPAALMARLRLREAAGWLAVRAEAAWPSMARPLRGSAKAVLRLVRGGGRQRRV